MDLLCGTEWHRILNVREGSRDYRVLRGLAKLTDHTFFAYAKLTVQLKEGNMCRIVRSDVQAVRGPFKWNECASNDLLYEDCLRLCAWIMQCAKTVSENTKEDDIRDRLGAIEFLEKDAFFKKLQKIPGIHAQCDQREIARVKDKLTFYLRLAKYHTYIVQKYPMYVKRAHALVHAVTLTWLIENAPPSVKHSVVASITAYLNLAKAELFFARLKDTDNPALIPHILCRANKALGVTRDLTQYAKWRIQYLQRYLKNNYPLKNCQVAQTHICKDPEISVADETKNDILAVKPTPFAWATIAQRQKHIFTF